MDRRELAALVRRGERAKVDLKAEFRLDVGDPAFREKQRSDLAWDIAAMANTRGGAGYLIIGIDEATGLPSNTGPAGIGADQIQQIVTTRCDPPVEFETEWVTWTTGEPVLVIVVPPSDRKPHVVTGRGVPIRRGATTVQAGHNDLIAMAQDTGSADFGRAVVRAPWREVLDLERVAAFLAAQGQPVDREQPDEGVLAGHGLLRREEGQTYPTAAAVLVFGAQPQTSFPQATLSLVRFAVTGADPVDSLVATGTVLEQLQQAEAFIRRNVAAAYPIEVVREALVNALLHRDYRAEEVEVSVRLRGDRIEVANPGVLVAGLELADVEQGIVEHPPRRNPTLVSLFFDQTRRPAGGVAYVERAGSGIRRMRERLAARSLPLPEFREDEERRLFLVTLTGVPLTPTTAAGAADATPLNPRQRRLLDQLAPGESISAAAYGQRYGVSRRTATADLAALVAAGRLEAIGSSASRRYRRPVALATPPLAPGQPG